jgi:hypothetical protein
VDRECGFFFLTRGLGPATGEAVTPESRFSLWKAYGVLPDVQVALENLFDGTEWDVGVKFADSSFTGDISTLLLVA